MLAKLGRQYSSKPLRAVFFDLDDTLVDTSTCDKVAHAAVVKLAAGGVDGTKLVHVTEWRAQLWLAALREQGVDDAKLAAELQSCFDAARMGAFRWNPGVEEMVATLKRKHVAVGIITNGHALVQRAKVEACRASDLFDIIIIGGDEPHEKPHPSIFMKACELANCDMDDAVMVGDNLHTDVEGGIQSGMRATVWVDYHNLGHVPLGAPRPDYVISRIGELLPVLEEIEAKGYSPHLTNIV
eukprot:jgi/Chlat1/6119/Chrsp409S00878